MLTRRTKRNNHDSFTEQINIILSRQTATNCTLQLWYKHGEIEVSSSQTERPNHWKRRETFEIRSDDKNV